MTSPIFAYAASLWRSMRQDYELAVQADFDKASELIGGAMVNADGLRLGVTEESLFFGPPARAYRFASDDLLAYWEAVAPRRRLDDYEAQWLGTMEVKL